MNPRHGMNSTARNSLISGWIRAFPTSFLSSSHTSEPRCSKMIRERREGVYVLIIVVFALTLVGLLAAAPTGILGFATTRETRDVSVNRRGQRGFRIRPWLHHDSPLK